MTGGVDIASPGRDMWNQSRMDTWLSLLGIEGGLSTSMEDLSVSVGNWQKTCRGTHDMGSLFKGLSWWLGRQGLGQE